MEQKKDVQISLDADQVRLSHVLEIKQLFQKHAGNTPVKLNFQVAGHSIALIHIDEKKGITISDSLKKSLSKIPSAKLS